MEVKDFIGLDLGKARTGFARGSNLARLAEPLKTVPTEQALAYLKELAGKGIAGIVVGLPRNLSGGDTAQTDWVRQWVVTAKSQIDNVFYWQDEALTSKIAEVQAQKNGKMKDVDALSAQIILQDFLDNPESMRVVI